MLILYVFIVLLILLTLLSTFGGAIKAKEMFVEEPFIASPPFATQSSFDNNYNNFKANQGAFGNNTVGGMNAVGATNPMIAGNPIGAGTIPNTFAAPVMAPLPTGPAPSPSPLLINSIFRTSTPTPYLAPTNVPITNAPITNAPITNAPIMTRERFGESNMDAPKIEMFVQPYDDEEKHASL